MRQTLIHEATGIVDNVIIVGDNYVPPAGYILGPDGGKVGDVWNGSAYTSPLPTLPTKVELVAYAAAKRWQVETGGITLQGGLRVATTEIAQGKIEAAYNAFANGTLAGPIQFKALTGWIEVGAAMISAVYAAVVLHVQACYAAEKVVVDAINADTITTVAQVDAASWPAN